MMAHPPGQICDVYYSERKQNAAFRGGVHNFGQRTQYAAMTAPTFRRR